MKVTIPIHRRGLTFIELMFATIILGVGMIIIASVFPVAISQQRETLDEGSVASLERAAVRTLEAAAAVHNATPAPARWLPLTALDTPLAALPADQTGSVDSLANNAVLWDRIKGDLINAGDPRYAFSPMYMRMAEGTNESRVTFFVVTLTSKDTASFDAADVNTFKKLMPSNVKISYHFKEDGTNPDVTLDPEQDTIRITDGTAVGGAPNSVNAAVTGAYIVRARHVKPGAVGTRNPLFPQNAIIKLGTQFEDNELKSPDPSTRVFRIAPGFELNRQDSYKGSTNLVDNVEAYAIGADPIDSTKKANRAISCTGITVTIANPG